MHFRVLLWTPAMAYMGGLLISGKNVPSTSVTFTAAFLGALAGLLLAMIFSVREQHRKNGVKGS